MPSFPPILTAPLHFLCLSLFVLLLWGCATPTTDQPMVVATTLENGLGGTGKTGPDEGGIGGTGRTVVNNETGGIGGTGRTVADNGIGGTGKTENNPELVVDNGLGGTGIVGTITQFGSIWVNNAHIHFEDATPVTINLQEAKQSDLRIGQVVAVLSDKGDEDYQARSIDIVHEVVGPIESINQANNHIQAMSQNIEVSDTTLIIKGNDEQAVPLSTLLSEDEKALWIKVSGHRRENGIIKATRIDILDNGSTSQVQVIGPLLAANASHTISGHPVEIADWLLPENTTGRILVNGHLQGDKFIAENVGQDSTQLILEMASDILIEGFVYESDIEDMVVIGGIEIELPEDFIDGIMDEYDLDDLPVHVLGIIDDEDAIDIEEFLLFSEDDDDFIDVYEEGLDFYEYELDEYELDNFDDGFGDDEFWEEMDYDIEDYEIEDLYDEYIDELDDIENFDDEGFEEYLEEHGFEEEE